MIRIRQATEKELNLVLDVELDAFKGDPEIRTLVTDMAADASARPLISLLAFDGELAVGHVYFSPAQVPGGNRDNLAMILAPLAVRTSYQKKGIGQQLVHAGFEYAQQLGAEIIFVLGHPEYYPRCGFSPVGKKGLNAPYAIPKKDADAWMVIELRKGALAEIGKGAVRCADAMMKPEYWRE